MLTIHASQNKLKNSIGMVADAAQLKIAAKLFTGI
jgi:hypothetical protein